MDKIINYINMKADAAKTVLWNLFAPNYFKLLQSRYAEMKHALDIRDHEYEADMDELQAENDALRAENEQLSIKYNMLRERIQAMATSLGNK